MDTSTGVTSYSTVSWSAYDAMLVRVLSVSGYLVSMVSSTQYSMSASMLRILWMLLNTHIQPTHSLRAWICWCALVALSLYLCSLLLIRMHTYMYDVYNATPACITYSYYCPCSVCTYVHPCLAPAPLLLFVCVPHIPIHIPMYVHLCTIQYTLRTTPYCTTVLVLCHLHIYMCVPKYTYSIHISTSITCYCMSSSHPLHIRYTSGTCYMAYAITRSVAYMLLCHVSSTPRYHDMECPYGHPYHQDIYISSYP